MIKHTYGGDILHKFKHKFKKKRIRIEKNGKN